MKAQYHESLLGSDKAREIETRLASDTDHQTALALLGKARSHREPQNDGMKLRERR